MYCVRVMPYAIGAITGAWWSVSPEALAQRTAPYVEPSRYAFMSDEQLDALRLAREQAGQPPDYDPRYLQLTNDRLGMLRAELEDPLEWRRALNAGEAQRLCDELFFDWGDSYGNDRWQEMVLGQITEVAPNPHLDPPVRQILRDALMEFYLGGGGSQTPYDMGDLGEALFRVGEYDDFEALEAARSLLDNACTWADAVGKHRCLKRYNGKREELFPESRLGTQDDPLRDGADALPEPYRQARRLAHRLLQDSHLDPARIEELARLGASDLGDGSLNDDLTARLLATYERILLRKRGLPRKGVATIDQELVRLPRDTDRIHGQKLWQLWSWAAVALRDRASDQMREFVDRQLPRADADYIRQALHRVARAIFPKETLPPLAPAETDTPAPATMPSAAQ